MAQWQSLFYSLTECKICKKIDYTDTLYIGIYNSINAAWTIAECLKDCTITYRNTTYITSYLLLSQNEYKCLGKVVSEVKFNLRFKFFTAKLETRKQNNNSSQLERNLWKEPQKRRPLSTNTKRCSNTCIKHHCRPIWSTRFSLIHPNHSNTVYINVCLFLYTDCFSSKKLSFTSKNKNIH